MNLCFKRREETLGRCKEKGVQPFPGLSGWQQALDWLYEGRGWIGMSRLTLDRNENAGADR
jgi:hypothetical protein